MFRLKGLFMEISNNTNSILNSNLNTNSSVSEEQKDRFDIFLIWHVVSNNIFNYIIICTIVIVCYIVSYSTNSF